MTHENFIWWLKGFCELTPQPPTPEQWQAIKEHLDTFFTKVTPNAPGDVTPTKTDKEKNQDILEQLIKNVQPANKPNNPRYRPFVVPDWPTYTTSDKIPNPITVTC